MSEDSTPPPTAKEDLSLVIRRAMLEAADMKDIEERVKAIGERHPNLAPEIRPESEGGPVQ